MSTAKKPTATAADRITAGERTRLLGLITAQQAATEELQAYQITLTKRYGLGPQDSILPAAGLIVRHEPDAVVPAPMAPGA